MGRLAHKSKVFTARGMPRKYCVLEGFSCFIILFLLFSPLQKISLEKLLFESALYLNIIWVKVCVY